jgi:hypothetical protein
MALCMTNTSEIKLEAVRAFWGTKYCREITFIDDVAGSLQGKYLILNTINANLEPVSVYIVTTDGPTFTGQIQEALTFDDDDDAYIIAEAFKLLIDTELSDYFVAELNTEGNGVNLKNKFIGGTSGDSGTLVTAGVVINDHIKGIGGELGRTAQGGSTVSLETQTVEIKADQTGEIILDDIAVGSSVSVEMGLIEVSKERLETIIGSVAGDKFSPEVGTDLVGFGESKLYQSLANLGGTLILHPIRLPMSNKSFDVVIHKCAPIPNDINYSGSDQQVLNVTFKAYLDKSVNEKVNLIAWGDWSKL